IGTCDLGTQFSNHLSVHFHHASLDEFIRFTARANPGVGQILVQTDGCVGIGILLVLDLLKRFFLFQFLAAWAHGGLIVPLQRGASPAAITLLRSSRTPPLRNSALSHSGTTFSGCTFLIAVAVAL